MSIATMVLGDPGSGKTTSLRNLNPRDVLLIQTLPKPLPFPNEWPAWDPKTHRGTVLCSDNATHIETGIRRAHDNGKSIVVIDDGQYLLANEFMRRSGEKGWDKFTEIGRHAWDVMMAGCGADPRVRVYFLWHTNTDDQGNTRAKTIGKMLDEKVFLEGMLTIVLRAIRRDRNYIFRTQTDGKDTCKSPMGMFPTEEIDNDLANVDRVICKYYGLPQSIGESK